MKYKRTLKKKTCRWCKRDFIPSASLQVVCCPTCAYELVKSKNEKKQKSFDNKAAKVKRADTKKQKKALKSSYDWLKEAQKECNAYIRLRDRDRPCISCGKYDHEIPDTFRGGKWDAGHYKSRGAYPELRFHPMNIHKQCKSCNSGSGRHVIKARTVSEEYKERLVERIGPEMVDFLNGPQIIQNLSIEDIEDIKVWYKYLLKLLKTLDTDW